MSLVVLVCPVMDKNQYSNGPKLCVFVEGIMECFFWPVVTALWNIFGHA